MNHLSYSLLQGRLSGRVPAGFPLMLLGLSAMIIAVMLLSVSLGSYRLELGEVIHVLRTSDVKDSAHTVVWTLRLPRVLAAIMVGAILAMSGALLQGVTRNALADPSLVGVSQGASLAVVFLIVMWPETPTYLRPMAAFGGALSAAFVVQWIASGKQSAASLRFILVGVGVAAMISSVTTAMLTYGQINRAMSALGWLAGSVHTATWDVCRTLFVCFCISIPALIWVVRPLAALRYGPEVAAGLGVRLRRDRFIVISLAVALAAFAVAAAGPIGFIGLIAPHAAKRLLRCGPGTHLILSALVGALVVAAADLAGRTLFAPIQLPAGLVSAVMGGPIFVILILKRAKVSQL